MFANAANNAVLLVTIVGMLVTGDTALSGGWNGGRWFETGLCLGSHGRGYVDRSDKRYDSVDVYERKGVALQYCILNCSNRLSKGVLAFLGSLFQTSNSPSSPTQFPRAGSYLCLRHNIPDRKQVTRLRYIVRSRLASHKMNTRCSHCQPS
jgi:hypothetical protein